MFQCKDAKSKVNYFNRSVNYKTVCIYKTVITAVITIIMMAAGLLLCVLHVFVCSSLLLTSLENVFFIYTFQFTPLKKGSPIAQTDRNGKVVMFKTALRLVKTHNRPCDNEDAPIV